MSRPLHMLGDMAHWGSEWTTARCVMHLSGLRAPAPAAKCSVMMLNARIPWKSNPSPTERTCRSGCCVVTVAASSYGLALQRPPQRLGHLMVCLR